MNLLHDILTRKRAEIEERRRDHAEGELAAAVRDAPPTLGLFDALSAHDGPLRIIAEVKRASPSAGPLAVGLDAPEQAQRYARAGATAISVLTDGPGFHGSLADLEAIRRSVELPLLCKDFILERYQLLEARLYGADAALLIVAALGNDELARLLAAAHGLGLAALVEVHDETDLEIALACDARLIGINNRDLKTFRVDLATSERLLPLVPPTVKVVAESGVRTPADAKRLRAASAANLLVGEALVRAPDPEELLRSMIAA